MPLKFPNSAAEGVTTPDLASRIRTQSAALVEVLAGFVAVHVVFRAIKHFTAWGKLEGAAHLNFTPGAVMILFVDYFAGRFTFAWGFGIASACEGLLFGCLREVTGSIVAGVVTHATVDVLVTVPDLIAGP